MSDQIDYAALIMGRTLTDRIPVRLGDTSIHVVLHAIPEEDLWEMQQRWEAVPDGDKAGARAADDEALMAAFDGFEDADGQRLDLGIADFKALVKRLNRGERTNLVAAALKLAFQVPEAPFSAPQSHTTG